MPPPPVAQAVRPTCSPTWGTVARWVCFHEQASDPAWACQGLTPLAALPGLCHWQASCADLRQASSLPECSAATRVEPARSAGAGSASARGPVSGEAHLLCAEGGVQGPSNFSVHAPCRLSAGLSLDCSTVCGSETNKLQMRHDSNPEYRSNCCPLSPPGLQPSHSPTPSPPAAPAATLAERTWTAQMARASASKRVSIRRPRISEFQGLNHLCFDTISNQACESAWQKWGRRACPALRLEAG